MRHKPSSNTTQPIAISRRDFFRKCAVGALLVTETVVYLRIANDRLSTKSSTTKRFSVSGIEDRDHELKALQISGLIKKRTVSGSFDGKQIKITFIGVEHLDKYGEAHGSKIAGITMQEGSDIIAIESPIYVHVEKLAKNGGDGYFSRLLEKMKSTGKKTALLEGYSFNPFDMWGLALANTLTFVGLLKAGSYILKKVFGESVFSESRNTKTPSLMQSPLVLSHAFGILSAAIQNIGVLLPLIFSPIKNYFGKYHSELDWADPVILMQRNRYYAETIRKLIEMGNHNILVVTGAAHTEGTIKRLEDERVPASDLFRKYFLIISPDGTQEEVLMDSTN